MTRPMNCPNCHTQILSVFAEPIEVSGSADKATAFCCGACEAVLSISTHTPNNFNPQSTRKFNLQPKDAK